MEQLDVLAVPGAALACSSPTAVQPLRAVEQAPPLPPAVRRRRRSEPGPATPQPNSFRSLHHALSSMHARVPRTPAPARRSSLPPAASRWAACMPPAMLWHHQRSQPRPLLAPLARPPLALAPLAWRRRRRPLPLAPRAAGGREGRSSGAGPGRDWAADVRLNHPSQQQSLDWGDSHAHPSQRPRRPADAPEAPPPPEWRQRLDRWWDRLKYEYCEPNLHNVGGSLFQGGLVGLLGEGCCGAPRAAHHLPAPPPAPLLLASPACLTHPLPFPAPPPSAVNWRQDTW